MKSAGMLLRTYLSALSIAKSAVVQPLSQQYESDGVVKGVRDDRSEEGARKVVEETEKAAENGGVDGVEGSH